MRAKFMLVIFMLVLGFSNWYSLAKDNRPNLVFCSALYLGDSGLLVPEIAIDENGQWRKATYNDLWVEQKFNPLIIENYRR